MNLKIRLQPAEKLIVYSNALCPNILIAASNALGNKGVAAYLLMGLVNKYVWRHFNFSL